MFTNWETAGLWIFQHHEQNPAGEFDPIPIIDFGHLRQSKHHWHTLAAHASPWTVQGLSAQK
jgi:hypothetical protein